MSISPATVKPFTAAHRTYVKTLYRKALKQSLDWIVFRDIWRRRAIEIRTEFEKNRDVRDPRALAKLMVQAEKTIAEWEHPDPYKPPTAADGTKWERNLPPPMFTREIREQARSTFLADRTESTVIARHAAEEAREKSIRDAVTGWVGEGLSKKVIDGRVRDMRNVVGEGLLEGGH